MLLGARLAATLFGTEGNTNRCVDVVSIPLTVVGWCVVVGGEDKWGGAHYN